MKNSLTPEEKKDMEELCLSGTSTAEIANMLGYKFMRVYNYLYGKGMIQKKIKTVTPPIQVIESEIPIIHTNGNSQVATIPLPPKVDEIERLIAPRHPTQQMHPDNQLKRWSDKDVYDAIKTTARMFTMFQEDDDSMHIINFVMLKFKQNKK